MPLELHRYYHYVASVEHKSALLLNFVLLYLIVYHSKFESSTYKYILGLACINDILLAFTAMICEPGCFASDGYMVLVSDGPLSNMPRAAYWTIVVWVTALLANIVGVAVQFFYRYAYVCQRHQRQSLLRKMALVVLPLAYVAFGAVVIAYTMNPSPGYEEAAEQILRNLNWTRSDGSVPPGFGSYMAEPKIAVYLAMFSFTSISSYGTVLWSQWRTIEYLKSIGTAMSAVTRRMHTEVHRALIATAISPLLACAPVLLFASSFVLRTSPGPAITFFIAVYNSIALVNPIMQIYFVRSYRDTVLSVLGKVVGKKATVGPSTAASAGLSMATTAGAGLSVAPARAVE